MFLHTGENNTHDTRNKHEPRIIHGCRFIRPLGGKKYTHEHAESTSKRFEVRIHLLYSNKKILAQRSFHYLN